MKFPSLHLDVRFFAPMENKFPIGKISFDGILNLFFC